MKNRPVRPVRRSRLVLLVTCGAVAAAFSACHGADAPTSTPANGAGGDAGAVSIAIPPASASTPRPPSAISGKVGTVTFTPGNVLIVQLDNGLIAVAADGSRTELPLPAGNGMALPAPPADSMAVANEEDVLLVSFAPLALATHAHGRIVGEYGQSLAAMVETETRAGDPGPHDIDVKLLVPGTTSVARLKFPDGVHGDVANVDVTKSGHFAVVTISEELPEGGSKERGFAYGLATGKRIAEVPPHAGIGAMLETAAFTGDHEIAFRGNEIVEIDLESGNVLRHAAFPCKSPQMDTVARGNPIVDPTGKHLFATCNEDGVLLDGRTFQRLRTFKDVIPGCDNGMDLPAHFSDDGKQLLVEGCGGEARLDISTGHYACGDADELMGAPYPGMGAPLPRRPAQAIGVAKCHSDAELGTENLQLSPHWQLAYSGEAMTLIGPKNARLTLPKDSTTPVVAPAEDRFAIVDGTHVVLHALPGGAVISDLSF